VAGGAAGDKCRPTRRGIRGANASQLGTQQSDHDNPTFYVQLKIRFLLRMVEYNGAARMPGNYPMRRAHGFGTAGRSTSTGTWEYASTFCVWLPASKRLKPRLPCEAMKMTSHL
jgi:hypothetical protein